MSAAYLPFWIAYAFDYPVRGFYAVSFRDDEVVRRLRERPMTLAELTIDFEPPPGVHEGCEWLGPLKRERRIGPVLRRLEREGRIRSLSVPGHRIKLWMVA